MKGKQESYYLEKEADDYFERNRSTDEEPTEYIKERVRQILKLMKNNGIAPKRVLEIGGAGGYLLSEIHKSFNCECRGVEPSQQAVDFANRTRKGISVRKGVASDLSEERTGDFDMVVLKGVLCWIGREELLRSIAEIDRVLADGGYLVLSDYLPEFPTMNRNTHVESGEVFCYKTNHAKIFLDTHLYSAIAWETYIDSGEKFRGAFDDNRNYVCILKKSLNQYYRRGKV